MKRFLWKQVGVRFILLFLVASNSCWFSLNITSCQMYVIFFSEFEQLGWPPSSKIERKAFRMFAFFIRRLELGNFTMLTKPDSDQPLDTSYFSEVEASSLSSARKSVNWSIFVEQTRLLAVFYRQSKRNGVTNGFKPRVSRMLYYSDFFSIQFLFILVNWLFVAVHLYQ